MADPVAGSPWVDRLLAAAVILVVAAGCLLRLPGLGRPVVRDDEAQTLLFASGAAPGRVRAELFDGRAHHPSDVMRYQAPLPGTTAAEVVATIVRNDPKQSPFYYLLVRAVSAVAGAGITTARGLAALLGLAALPLAFGLARELFASRTAGWMMLGLVAVSPVHCVLARDARPYTLWVAVVVGSCWLLLLATRRGAGPRRHPLAAIAGYGATTALALYCHALTVLVMAAQLGWVAFDHGPRSRAARQVAGAQGIAVLAYAPLAVAVARQLWGPAHGLGWVATETPVADWAAGFLGVLALGFLDLGPVPGAARWGPGALALAVGATSLVVLVRSGERRAAALVVLLGATCTAPFVVADLATGGWRSLVARYLLPGLVALELAVAFALAHGLQRGARRTRRSAAWAAALLGLAGVASGLARSGAELWWHNRDAAAVVEMSDALERMPRPLLVAGAGDDLELDRFLALAHRLGEGVELVLVGDMGRPALPRQATEAYMLHLQAEVAEALEAAGWRFDATGIPGFQRASRRGR